MPRKRTTGARFHLGQPWDGMLEDFLAAHFDGSATVVARAAFKAYIEDQLAKDPESNKRYQTARRERLGIKEDGNVVVLPSSK
jgi:hypothetical protein